MSAACVADTAHHLVASISPLECHKDDQTSSPDRISCTGTSEIIRMWTPRPVKNRSTGSLPVGPAKRPGALTANTRRGLSLSASWSDSNHSPSHARRSGSFPNIDLTILSMRSLFSLTQPWATDLAPFPVRLSFPCLFSRDNCQTTDQ